MVPPELLSGAGLDVPQTTQLLHTLNQAGWHLPQDALSVGECADAILAALGVQPQA